MAHLIQELSDLTDLKFSELQKAINQASFMAAIENEMQAPSNPLEGRKVGPPISYAEQQASYADQSDDTLTGTPSINWDLQPEATIRQPGSTLVANLKRGDKWINLQSTAPSAQFEKFYNFVCEYIAASLGWSNEVVLKKFQNNYSASRGTLLLIWRTAQIERNEMVADFLDPVLEMVLSEYIAAGKISAPGWSDPILRAAWMSGTWQGQPIPNIDPLKAAEADRAYVELGAQTLDDVAREYNGSSGKANRAANQRQFAELPASPFAKTAPAAAPPDENSNDNGGENGKP
jgi:capsid protein